MKRPSKHEYYLDIALAVSKRSTCLRTHYGAVIVRQDHILSTGYNGSAKGEVNCCDRGTCLRQGAESRTDYGECPAKHAEDNAIKLRMVPDISGADIYIVGELAELKTLATGHYHSCEEVFALSSMKYGVGSLPCEKCRTDLVQTGIENVIIWGAPGKPLVIPVKDLNKRGV